MRILSDAINGRKPKGAALFAAALLASVSLLHAAIGIMSRFSDVVLENIKPGVYNLRALKNLPYVVLNPGDARVDILVEPVAPERMMEGYEPIPDPSWLQIVPNRFAIDPQQNHFSDIILTVPDDPEFTGRHFQVMIWAHTVDTGFTGAGVNSRLRFSVGTVGPAALQREKKRKAMLTLDFDLKPENLTIGEVPLGAAMNAKEERRASLKLTNRADDPLKVRLASIPWQPGFSLPAGYEAAPDASWLKFKKDTASVKPLTIVEFVPVVNIPDRPEYAGKKFAFLVKAEVDSEKVIPVEVYSRVLVTTPAAR